MAKLQLKRGSQATLTGTVFDIGEPIYCKDTKDYRIGDGVTAWENLKPHVKEAPSDNKQYVRKNADWEEVSVPTGALTDAAGSIATDGKYYARKDGSWAEVVASGGSGIADAPTDNKIYGRQNASWVDIDNTITIISENFGDIITRSIEGVVYETTLMYWRAPAACTIDSVSMSLSSNPSATGSYCKVQVMKNGTLETNSIFSADTPMQITELTSASNGIYTASGTLDSNQTTLATGDVIQFRVNQADTGSADLLVQMKVTFT